MKASNFSYLLFAILLPSLTYAASPVADAGEDITIADFDADESVIVVLDASGTTDSDGDIVSYEWTWSGGSASGEVTEGTFPASDTPVSVTLTVTDGASNVAVDTLEVTAYKKETALFTDFDDLNYNPGGLLEAYVEGDTLLIDHGGMQAFRNGLGGWAEQTVSNTNTDYRLID